MKTQNAHESTNAPYALSHSKIRKLFTLSLSDAKKEGYLLSSSFSLIETLTDLKLELIIPHRAHREFLFYNYERVCSIRLRLAKAKLLLEMTSVKSKKSRETLLYKISKYSSDLDDAYAKALQRFKSVDYCKRKLVKLVLSEMLYDAQKNKEIGGKSGKSYATNLMVNYRRMQKQYNADFLASKSIVINDKKVDLLSFANTAQKKVSELYAKIKGLQNHADDLGYDWAFVTLTASPSAHANPVKGRRSWNRESAKSAQKELSDKWAAFGKELANLGYPMKNGSLFGLRVVEPHQDGTPHWHMVIFYDSEISDLIKALFHKHFVQGDSLPHVPECPHSMKFVEGLPSDKAGSEGVASAASYAFKYIVKCVGADCFDDFDIHSFSETLDTEKVAASIDRIESWKAAVGVRAYQGFGFNGMSNIWNSTRKVSSRTGRLNVYDNLESKSYRIEFDPFCYASRHIELMSLPSESEAHDLRLSQYDSLSADADYEKVVNLDDSESPCSYDDAFSDLDSHFANELKLHIDSNGHLNDFDSLSIEFDLLKVMSSSVSGDFSLFLKLCSSHSVDLIKEPYLNRYGEEKTKVIGVNAGSQVYLFKQYNIVNSSPLNQM